MPWLLIAFPERQRTWISWVDIITAVDGVDFESAWNGRAEIEIDGVRIPVIGKAHLIANKRAVGRPQDLVDADLLESGE